MLIVRIQQNWKQAAGTGLMGAVPKYYNFFHFMGPVDLPVNGQIVRTKPNACIISRPKQIRGFQFFDDTTMNWTHNDVSIAPLLEQYGLPVGEVFYPADPSFISELFRRIKREFYSENMYKERILDGYMEELLIKLSRSIQPDARGINVSKKEEKLLQDLRWQLLSKPEENRTVEEMAKAVSLSPSRFHAVYKAMFGVPPIKDLINAKVEQAKSVLLMDRDATLISVAEKLGYKNQYHFIRHFKAVTGITPGIYRKENE